MEGTQAFEVEQVGVNWNGTGSLDLDLDSYITFSIFFGERDREGDLLRDFSYSSFDLLENANGSPASGLGFRFAFDLDFPAFERDRDRPYPRPGSGVTF